MPVLKPCIAPKSLLVILGVVLPTTQGSGQVNADPMILEIVAEAPVGFTKVGGVRELSDGRVLLVDQLEQEGYLLDRSLRSRSIITKKGSGPKEYRTPFWIVPLSGDSSGIIDIGSLRVLLLDSDGKPYDVVSGERAGGGRILYLATTGYRYETDGRQFLYSDGAGSRWSPQGGVLLDSVAIERWRFGDVRRDTVAMMPINRAGPFPHRPQPEWAVCSDGRVVIAYPSPYRVAIVDPSGDRVLGAEISYDPVPVTGEIRERGHGERTADRLVHRAPRGGGGGYWYVRKGNPSTEPEAWPKTLPPFLNDAVHCTPNHAIWIERAVPPGLPVLVDEIDAQGTPVGQFRLPAGSRIVGFGQTAVFVVVKDALDLEHLIKLRVPGWGSTHSRGQQPDS